MRLPIRARVTIWSTAVLALIVALLGAFVFVRMRASLVNQVDHSLALASSEISTDFTTGAETEFQDVSDRSMAGLDRTRSAAQILGVDGRVVDHAALASPRRPLVGRDVVRRALRGE